MFYHTSKPNQTHQGRMDCQTRTQSPSKIHHHLPPPPATIMPNTQPVDDLVPMRRPGYTTNINKIPILSSLPPHIDCASRTAAMKNHNQTAIKHQFLETLSSKCYTGRSPQHVIHDPNPTRIDYTSTFLYPVATRPTIPTSRLESTIPSTIDHVTHG